MRTTSSRRSGLQSRRLARRVETNREGKRLRLLKGKSITCLILTCPPLIIKLSKEQSEAGYPHTDVGLKVYDPRAFPVRASGLPIAGACIAPAPDRRRRSCSLIILLQQDSSYAPGYPILVTRCSIFPSMPPGIEMLGEKRSSNPKSYSV